MKKQSVTAIIVAGGTGTRMGSDCPKQFLKINGVEIIEHTVSKFVLSESVNNIIIVCHKDYVQHTKEHFADFDFDIKVVEGSDTRQKSVCCGLDEVTNSDYVLIHDAVRCCIDVDRIRLVVEEVKSKRACALGVRVVDTLNKTDNKNKILKTIDRTDLWHIQTPQAFETELIKRAHAIAVENNFEATDDCSVAQFAGNDVYIIEGSSNNIKITTPEDIILAGLYLKG